MSNNSQTVMYREMYTVHVYEYIELYRTHIQYCLYQIYSTCIVHSE